MQLITLGTSHGMCEKGRYCTASLLQVNKAYYLFDCGAPVVGLMKNLDLDVTSIKCAFITHLHEDHVGCLPNLYGAFSVYYPRYDLKIFMPTKNGIDGFKNWMHTLYANVEENKNIQFSLVNEGIVYEDENISVTALYTHHLKQEIDSIYRSFAYIIEAEGKRILITGDMDCNFYDFPNLVKNTEFDFILSEFVHFNDIEKAVDHFAMAKTKRIAFHHYYPGKYTKLDCFSDRIKAPFSFAKDEEIFEI